MCALKGIRVIEMAGLAPVPYAGMILQDFGCEVIRVDRCTAFSTDVLSYNKKSLAIDLKTYQGQNLLLQLSKKCDIIIEPFRPGVMEKMGLGPKEIVKINPKIIYARLTGFGQAGKYSQKAGHDLNYIALSGLLSCLGESNQKPHWPINLLGDFVGGSLFCVIGILMALINRYKTGLGQVVDSSMVDGSAYLATFLAASRELGIWRGERGQNLLDGGAHFYSVYKTKDNKYISVAALEPKFYSQLLLGLNLDPNLINSQMDEGSWKNMKEVFSNIFKNKTREQWIEIFHNLDACVVPVYDFHSNEASLASENVERNVYNLDNINHIPNPAPRLSDTPAVSARTNTPFVGEHTTEILRDILCLTSKNIQYLYDFGVIYSSTPSKI